MYFLKNKFQSMPKTNQGVFMLNFCLCLSLLCFLFFYLFQVSSQVNCDYQIREKKTELAELVKQNRKLETKISQLRSPHNLAEKSEELGMVKTGAPIYLTLDTEVALKD